MRRLCTWCQCTRPYMRWNTVVTIAPLAAAAQTSTLCSTIRGTCKVVAQLQIVCIQMRFRYSNPGHSAQKRHGYTDKAHPPEHANYRYSDKLEYNCRSLKAYWTIPCPGCSWYLQSPGSRHHTAGSTAQRRT